MLIMMIANFIYKINMSDPKTMLHISITMPHISIRNYIKSRADTSHINHKTDIATTLLKPA